MGTPAPIPAFFVPGFGEADAEAAYATCAAMCQLPVPPLGKRVYSITFSHNGVIWTATVGDMHRGVSTVIRGKYKGWEERHVEDSIVWAIFPHPSCYQVVVDPSRRSSLANPSMVGIPRGVTLFATP